MYTAIAIYGTENISPEKALSFSKAFFKCVNIPITKAGYYKYLDDGDHKGDHEIIDVSIDDLEEKINNKNATSFRLYSEIKDHAPWFASFGYTTDDFGGFFHLDAQYVNESSSYEEIIDFIKELSDSTSLTYGIAYPCDKMSKAFYYAAGNNLATIYPFENASLFKKETPGRFQGKERYKSMMLRMVYPLNILNERHLSIDVNGFSLKEWILKDPSRGELKELNNSVWLWNVESDAIETVNHFLGELGILIAWKNPSSKISSKKIP